MSYLLDTNVISEFSKRRPNAAIIDFLSALPASKAWLSVISLGEIRRGVEIEASRNPEAAEAIGAWLVDTETQFATQILSVTIEVAYCWGKISADRSRPVADTLIAATAMVHDLTLVTRNERDFTGLGLRLLNPWR